MMKKNFIITIIALSLIIFTSCFKDPEKRFNDSQANYDALWEIIDTRYCYLDYKGIDWQHVYTKYLNKANSAFTQQDFFDVLAEMLYELEDGHVNLYSPFNTSRYWEWYTDYPANFNSSVIYSDKYLGSDYLIANGMHYKKLSPAVGYIYYNSFMNPISDATMSYVFDYFKDCKGIIIDVRNNGGGSLSYSEQLASYFFDTEQVTGYIAHKIGDGHSDFSELLPLKTAPHYALRWDKKVAVLTNRRSYSATNDFVNRMKSAPNAVIIGDRTGGGGGMPLSSELPNGWAVRFSACPMFDAQKQHTEWGIDPDIRANTSESSEYDQIIDMAVRTIVN